MPGRVWNAEADAKLFCGVLAQLQNTNTKLDYDALAKYMGADTVVGAVKNRMSRLKAAAKAEGPSTPSVQRASSPASTPDLASPSIKRKRTPGPRKPRSKKPKNEQVDENSPKMEMDPLGLKEEGEKAMVDIAKYVEEGNVDTGAKIDPEETEDDLSMDV